MLKLLFAADLSFCFSDVASDVNSVDHALRGIVQKFKEADYSIVNLETVLGEKEKLTPIAKSGPCVLADPSFVSYLDYLGVDAVALANNHIGDYDEEGVRSTLEALKNYSTFGAGKSLQEAYEPLYIKNNEGDFVGILNVCENEFGVATDEKAGTAGFDPYLVDETIEGIKKNGALPIVFFHGGNEYYPFPSPKRMKLFRHLVNVGPPL